MLVEVESKVPSELVHVLFVQTSKVILPVSFASESLNVAVSVGVVVLSCAALAGVTRVGAFGAAFEVLFVIEALFSVAVAAALPAAVPAEFVAVSRTQGVEPGLVYVSASVSRWWTV